MPSKLSLRPGVWDFFPTILVSGWFAFIGVINWDYEKKFFQPVNDHGHLNHQLGPVLLVIAFGLSLASGGFFFVMRKYLFDHPRESRDMLDWCLIVLPGLVAVVLFFASLAVVTLTPAAFTMMEQIAAHPPQE